MKNNQKLLGSLKDDARNLDDHLALFGTVLIINEIGEKKLRALLKKERGGVDKAMEDLITRARPHITKVK